MTIRRPQTAQSSATETRFSASTETSTTATRRRFTHSPTCPPNSAAPKTNAAWRASSARDAATRTRAAHCTGASACADARRTPKARSLRALLLVYGLPRRFFFYVRTHRRDTARTSRFYGVWASVCLARRNATQGKCARHTGNGRLWHRRINMGIEAPISGRSALCIIHTLCARRSFNIPT